MTEANWPIQVGGQYESAAHPDTIWSRVTAVNEGRVFFEKWYAGEDKPWGVSEVSERVFRDIYLPEDQSPIPALVEALEDILEALPKETDDADWWPDELKAAVRQANAALEKAGQR